MRAINDQRVHTSDPDSLGLIDALRQYLPRLMAKHQSPGLNIAVADKGGLIWEAGLGFADIARGRLMMPDSVYRSGSLAKTYTATAAMMLVDRGVIALQDPINTHLPFEVHNPLGQRAITVRDLLVHASGLSEDASSGWEAGGQLADELAAEYAREWSPMYGGRSIRRWSHAVGTAWTYSNLGVATLGLIVETANPEHLSFSAFVQRNIMDPLGMTHSCFPPAQSPGYVPPKIWSQITRGYSRLGQVDIPTLPVHLHESPAGGALGRPADHIRLLLAMIRDGELDGYRLFSREIARMIISPVNDHQPLANARAPSIGEQGLIWRLKDWGSDWTSFEHGGGHMFGWRTQGRAWPHYQAAVTVAINQWSLPDDSRDVDEVADFIGTWLRYRQPAAAAQVDRTSLSYASGALLAGAYRVTFGIPGNVPEGALEEAIADTRDRSGDWDQRAFRRGFEAVAKLPPTLEAIHSFWSSERSEIDRVTVRAAYTALGGKSGGSAVWSLLPTE